MDPATGSHEGKGNARGGPPAHPSSGRRRQQSAVVLPRHLPLYAARRGQAQYKRREGKHISTVVSFALAPIRHRLLRAALDAVDPLAARREASKGCARKRSSRSRQPAGRTRPLRRRFLFSIGCGEATAAPRASRAASPGARDPTNCGDRGPRHLERHDGLSRLPQALCRVDRHLRLQRS